MLCNQCCLAQVVAMQLGKPFGIDLSSSLSRRVGQKGTSLFLLVLSLSQWDNLLAQSGESQKGGGVARVEGEYNQAHPGNLFIITRFSEQLRAQWCLWHLSYVYKIRSVDLRVRNSSPLSVGTTGDLIKNKN